MDIGGFFSWKCILHVYIYISIFKCDSFFTHINERGTNKLPPTRRVQERSKGDTTCQITSQNPSCWHPSCLSKACTTRKDSESEWLAKDNPETNPITIKPETAELFSWIPLFYCSPPGFPFPKNLLLCQHMCLLGQFISESLTRAQFQALEGVPEGKLHGSKQSGVKATLQVLPTILYRKKNFLPWRKEWTLRLITFSSQPMPVSGRSQEILTPVIEN